MKKQTAGLALAAVTGFTALTATPAFAMATPYPNCDAAAADGVYNIPQGDPRYAPGLDRDSDGIACENPEVDPPSPSPTAPTVPPTMPDATSTPQMTHTPKGGVDAGVAVKDNGPDTGAYVLGGGLLLVAAGAGTYMVRRHNGNHV